MKTVKPYFQRLALVTGADTIEKLQNTRVLVAGLGGVGGWAAEALARSGVGKLGIIDSDKVCITNVNRQTQALFSTLGKSKTEALKARLLDINPELQIEAWETVYSKDNTDAFNFEKADYIIDAIDSLTCKLHLIEEAAKANVKLYSSMGMAGKLDPSLIKTASIWKTKVCPLARLVRQGLRKRGFAGGLTVVYSEEEPKRAENIPVSCGKENCLCPPDVHEWCGSRKQINGSAVTVTAAAGMTLASLVLMDVYNG